MASSPVEPEKEEDSGGNDKDQEYDNDNDDDEGGRVGLRGGGSWVGNCETEGDWIMVRDPQSCGFTESHD